MRFKLETSTFLVNTLEMISKETREIIFSQDSLSYNDISYRSFMLCSPTKYIFLGLCCQEKAYFIDFIVNKILSDRGVQVVAKIGDLAGIRGQEKDASDLTSASLFLNNKIHENGKTLQFGNEINMMRKNFEASAISNYPRRMGGNTNKNSPAFKDWIKLVLKDDSNYSHKSAGDDEFVVGMGPLLRKLLGILDVACEFGKGEKTAEEELSDLQSLTDLKEFFAENPYHQDCSSKVGLHQTKQSIQIINNTPTILLDVIENTEFKNADLTTDKLEAVNKLIQDRKDLYDRNFNLVPFSELLNSESFEAKLKQLLNCDPNYNLKFMQEFDSYTD